jgi:ATP-dependent DNA helicase RecG
MPQPPSSHHLSLDSPVQYVKGIGPKRAEVLAKIEIRTVEDLLSHYPRRYLDRSNVARIKDLRPGETVTVVAQVYSGGVKKGRTTRFSLLVGDNTGFLECVWFQGGAYLTKAFQAGEVVAFSGKVSFYRGLQLVHPEYDKISEEGEINPIHTGGIVPLYPSSETLSRAGLDSRGFRRILRNLLDALKLQIREPLPPDLRDRLRLTPLAEAVEAIHFPRDFKTLQRARERLKFDELFAMQVFLMLQHKHREIEKKGISFEKVGDLTRQFIQNLPFELTEAQKRVLHEIREDMKSVHPMNRLLQGDVGSGKTLVAIVAMLIAVENGYQSALMAPTEILAEQHFITIHRWLESLGVRVALLKGGQRSVHRRKILEGLKNGDIQIAIGTHALVQEGVEFKTLGFVVIDEQHRFGVMQRADLRRKGLHPDVLVMTATPIPRTLALTLYGDLDVSIMDELPKGRIPVRTVWRGEEKREAIYEFIREEIKKGRQAYVVYPLVEESEKVDLAAATEGYETLSKSVFAEFKIALLHGRMKGEEKESVMQAFKAGEIRILVSTTVIEVGVDVPNATVMLVEHAERFGLTQLHQLRGRVGRGGSASTCILLARRGFGDDALKRLKTMESTNDGFKISEMDLEIRGPGELFGTRQHGLLNLKIADLVTDGPILQTARKEAQAFVQDDPRLVEPRNHAVKEIVLKKYKKNFGLIEVG